MRLPNGFGTCYRLTGKRRNPYRAAVCVGEKENGQLIYRTIGYYKHKQDGIQALKEYHEYPSDKKEITLEELYTEWSISKYPNITHQTARGYKTAWNHFDKLKQVRVKDIRAAEWQKLIDGKNMSWSALHKIKTLAGLLSAHSMQNDIIHKNYAQFIKLPKKVKLEHNTFTDIELAKLKELQVDEWVQTVIILIYTGLRITEFVKLTLFEVDLEVGVIKTGIKSEAGHRIIPIHKNIIKFISEFVSRNENYLIEVDGKSLSADRYRKDYYYPALKRAGVRKLSPHKCRHTFATLMARQGVDTLSIQRLMGHTDYALTANIYTHPEVEQLRKAVERLS